MSESEQVCLTSKAAPNENEKDVEAQTAGYKRKTGGKPPVLVTTTQNLTYAM